MHQNASKIGKKTKILPGGSQRPPDPQLYWLAAFACLIFHKSAPLTKFLATSLHIVDTAKTDKYIGLINQLPFVKYIFVFNIVFNLQHAKR